MWGLAVVVSSDRSECLGGGHMQMARATLYPVLLIHLPSADVVGCSQIPERSSEGTLPLEAGLQPLHRPEEAARRGRVGLEAN